MLQLRFGRNNTLTNLSDMLLISRLSTVDTIALTKSFGWEGAEVFQQQDVQELCRVLFDALEDTFRGTNVDNVIDVLYAGELVDYIKCVDVEYQSERRDKFLDYSLAITPFGSNRAMSSLLECIEHFLEPEVLEGDNQYFVESIGRKVDAIKGLKFSKLPQIMSVQLKRFVFDFSGDSIVHKKINDEVRFPFILDMNKYVASLAGNVTSESFEKFLSERIERLKQKPIEDRGSAGDGCTGDDDSTPDLVDYNGALCKELLQERLNSISDFAVDSDHRVKPEFPDASGHFNDAAAELSDEEKRALVEKNGPWIYELFAVMIHAGAITGFENYLEIFFLV
jgi:ubiquitin carboxyl-terminal hydrolase 47